MKHNGVGYPKTKLFYIKTWFGGAPCISHGHEVHNEEVICIQITEIRLPDSISALEGTVDERRQRCDFNICVYMYAKCFCMCA